MTNQTQIDQLSQDEVVRRQAAGDPFVASYGLGVDSTAGILELHEQGIRPDLILFADVGSEKAATYAYLVTFNAKLRAIGFPTVTVVRYETTDRSGIDPRTGRTYQDLEGQCHSTGRLPSLAYGSGKHSCSIKWKAEAQDRFLKTWKPAIDAWANGRQVIKAIFYDCSAADMKRGTFSTTYQADRYVYAYPLRWFGWVREDCKAAIRAAGLPVPPKSSCFFCPAMKAQELRDLAVTEPAQFVRAIELEDVAKFAAEIRIALGGKASTVELGGLWTLMRPSKNEPTSWRVFAEHEGLLAQALQALADQAGPTPLDELLERAA